MIVGGIVAFGLARTAAAECRITRVERAGDRPALLRMANEFLELTFDLDSGGARCRQIRIEPLDRSLNRPFEEEVPFNYRRKVRRFAHVPAAGYFVERSGDFRARNVGLKGGMWFQFLSYKLTVVKDTTAQAVVEFATVPDVHLRADVENADAVGIYRQMTYIKRITLETGSPLVRIQHIYRNFGTDVEITLGATSWVNPTTPKRFYMPDADGVHYCIDPHIGASGSLNTAQPGAGWLAYIENDNVGAAVFADQPGRLDCLEIWNAGKNRGHDALMLFYNLFVTSQEQGDLEHSYHFAPLVGLPRLDGIDREFACGIEFDNARYQEHLEGLEGIQSPRATKTMQSATYMPRPWEDGKAAAVNEPIQVCAAVLPWKPGTFEVRATVRRLPGAEAVRVAEDTFEGKPLVRQTLETIVTPEQEGTYVVSVDVLRDDKVTSRFERPFVVGEPSASYQAATAEKREGVPLFSKLILKVESALESVTGTEAQRAVKGRGPFFFQMGPGNIKPWPGMVLLSPEGNTGLYDKSRGYGWVDLKGLRVCAPRREGTKPDYLGAYGVWGGQFLLDVEPGNYEVALLSNDIAGRYVRQIGRGDGIVHEVLANGKQVYKRKLTNKQLTAADLERPFHYTACRNQYVAFNIAVQPLKDLGACRVVKTDLVGRQGARIGAERVRVGVVKYIPTPNHGLGHTPDGRMLKMPPGTPGFESVPIDQGINRYFWVVIRIRPDAEPGLYTGDWTFQPTQAPPMTIPVQLYVYPVVLGRPAITWWNCYYPYYPGCSLDRLLDDAHEHGMLYLRAYHMLRKPPEDRKLTREEMQAFRDDYRNQEWRSRSGVTTPTDREVLRQASWTCTSAHKKRATKSGFCCSVGA